MAAASIARRGNSYQLTWHEHTSESGTVQRFRVSLGNVTREHAQRAAKIKQLELESGVKLDIGASPRAAKAAASKTLSDFYFEQYQPWHNSQYPATHGKLRDCWRTLGREFGSTSMPDISTKMIEAWKARRSTERSLTTGRQINLETVRKEYNQLRAMLGRAVAWGDLRENPCAGVQRIPKVKSQKPRMLSKDELERLYAASGKRADWWRFIVNTGMRRSEACKAMRSDVTMHKGTCAITIESTPEARTKSGKARYVPLNEAAQAALAGLGEERLFPSMERGSFSRLFKHDARRAGVSATIHALRHTFGSHLAASGVPANVIQNLMGHSSILVTQIYMWMVPGAMSSAVATISL